MSDQLIDLIDEHLCAMQRVVKDPRGRLDDIFGSRDAEDRTRAATIFLEQEPEIDEQMHRLAKSYHDLDPIVELFEQNGISYDRFTTVLDFLIETYVPSQCVPSCGTGKAIGCLAFRAILLFHQLSQQTEEFESLMGDITEAMKCEKEDEEKDRLSGGQ